MLLSPLGLIFVGYVPLASQSPYPIIVYSVAMIDPVLVTFGQICNFRDPNFVTHWPIFRLNEGHFTFHLQYKHSEWITSYNSPWGQQRAYVGDNQEASATQIIYFGLAMWKENELRSSFEPEAMNAGSVPYSCLTAQYM